MSQTFAFYTARAEEAAAEAGNAVLGNVRERALRSEAAWREMANRVQRLEEDRRAAEVIRAERRQEAEDAARSDSGVSSTETEYPDEIRINSDF